MKFFLIVLLLFLFSTSWVGAQNQVNDFKFQQEKYRSFYNSYEVAKNEYLKQKTLKAQSDAFVKTKDLGLQRNQVLRAYFLAIKYRLSNSNYLKPEIKNQLISQIETEIDFLEKNYSEIKNLENVPLETLFELLIKVADKQEDFYRLAHKSLAYISLSKTEQFQQNYLLILRDLEQEVKKSDKQFLNNWFMQAKNTSQQSQDLIIEAENLILKIEDDDREDKVSEIYEDVMEIFEQTKQKFKTGIDFQLEIARQLENHEQ